MCGITGLFDTQGEHRFGRELIQNMTDAVAHRGPDGDGFYEAPGVAFGHRRLAIIDLGGGHQPMSTADGVVTVTFNGEIYNYKPLRAELEALGAVFQTQSDTEVLLQGWRIWGEGLVDRIGGMFAFALWDSSAQTLFMARDRFGKKPLHYVISPDGRLAFGSEIKSLMCVPDIDRTLDNEAVEDFFAYGYVPDPKTIYRAIRKLAPGRYMVIKRGSAPRIRRYWNLLDHMCETGPNPELELIERLNAAVKSRLMSEVPLGALLSGGVDSSGIVALMAGDMSEPVNTFSIGFGEKAFDESAYALAVAKQYGTKHDLRQVDAGDFSLVPRMGGIFDEPFGDISAIPTFAVCQQARRSVTVALSGDGGDEALAGYRRYAFHNAEEKLRALAPAPVRKAVLGLMADLYPRGAWLPRPLRAKATLRELSLDGASAYFHSVSALPHDVRHALLSPEFRKAQGGYDPADVVRTPFNVDHKLDPLQRAQYADVETYLPGDILTKVDRTSMANSLELRAPLLDADFFAWAFSLPASEKLTRQRGGKAVFKKALESRLPHDLLYRPKQGFTLPLAEWLRGPLKTDVEGLATNPHLIASGVINLANLQTLVRSHMSGAGDHSKAIWLVWVFTTFLAQNASASTVRLAA